MSTASTSQPALPDAMQVTPSLESILHAFTHNSENKDTELLRAIVLAKAAEDQVSKGAAEGPLVLYIRRAHPWHPVFCSAWPD